MYPSQLMLSKIKNRESRRTHSVSTTKRVFAAFRQCLKRVCLAPPLESTLFSPRECPEGCLPEELERPWRKAVPPQTDCRRKGDASPFPACRQWLCGGWRFFIGESCFLVLSWTCSRERWWHSKQRTMWNWQWKARLHKLQNLCSAKWLRCRNPTLAFLVLHLSKATSWRVFFWVARKGEFVFCMG